MLMLTAGHQQENVREGCTFAFTRIKPMTKDYVSFGSNLHEKAPHCYSGCGAGNQRHLPRLSGKNKIKKI